jgi:hopanoid biosynthesis associated RND transporter like protein HpnN
LLPENSLNRRTKFYLKGIEFFAWPIIVVSVLLAGLAVYYTFHGLTIRTSRNDLVASDRRLLQLTHQMDRAFGGRDGLVVVVENGHPEVTTKFADALAAELRRYPHRFPDLFYRLDPKSFRRWALLYLDTNPLIKLKDNLVSQKNLLSGLAADPGLLTFYKLVNEQMTRAMIGNLFTGFLTEEKRQEQPDLDLLNAGLKELHLSLEGSHPYVSPLNALYPKELGDDSQEGYFFTENNKFLLFMVTEQPDGYHTIHEDVELLRDAVARVKGRFPGIQAGVTGPDALQSDEMSSAMKDMTLATWLSLVGQMILLIVFLRSLKRTLVEGMALIVGLCWTFGLVTLVVGHLNILSLVFAPLLLGLTIDYGIHWFCRLEEELAGQHCNREALACTFRRSAPGIIYAGRAAILSFLPLAFVSFKGLAELGLILIMGIVAMLVASLLLIPALVMVSEGCAPAGIPEDYPPSPSPFLHLHWTQRRLIVALGVLISALGGVCLLQVHFDLNPLHLQNPKTESVVWENQLLKGSKYSTSYGALITATLEELEARSEAFKKLATVSHVESVLSFLPAQIEEKRRLLTGIEPVLNSVNFAGATARPANPKELTAILRRINFKVDEAAKNLGQGEAATKQQVEETHQLINKIIPLLTADLNPQAAARLADFNHDFGVDLKGKWDLLRDYAKSALDSDPPTPANLPRPVRERFLSPQGAYLLRVFPSQDIWNFKPLKRFVNSLWSVDPKVVGDPVLLYVFTRDFRNSILFATGISLVLIAAMLVILFRSLKLMLLAFIPLVVGTGLTLILMWVLNLSFNQANVLFLPLILGEGIEFGIIILTRWQLEESTRAIALPASTAKGVALAALTTTVGFGSLMISGHRGIFSLGLLATVGSLSVLVASLVILPAFLRLREKDYELVQLSIAHYLGLGQWLHHSLNRKSDEKATLHH